MEYKNIGLFIGRFQPLHNGHVKGIEESCKILTRENTEEEKSLLFLVIGHSGRLDDRHFWTPSEIADSLRWRGWKIEEEYPVKIMIGVAFDINNPIHYQAYITERLQDIFREHTREELDLTKEKNIFSGEYGVLDCFNDKEIGLINDRWKKHKFDRAGELSGTMIRNYVIDAYDRGKSQIVIVDEKKVYIRVKEIEESCIGSSFEVETDTIKNKFIKIYENSESVGCDCCLEKIKVYFIFTKPNPNEFFKPKPL
jgi:nicotinamide mononucleotide adenylyltransferase